MSFWDSSALVPLLVEENSTDATQKAYVADDSILVWWGTQIECTSAIARLEREAALTPEDAAEACRRLGGLAADWNVVGPSEAVREAALRLLRVHVLTAADALQLAAAIIASENRPPSLELVTVDARLAIAADREGFRLHRLKK